MLFYFMRETLQKCLEIVEKALPFRTTIPVLDNIFFEDNGNQVSFKATNLEVEIICKLICSSGQKGAVLLPAKIIEIVRSLPLSELQLTLNEENHRIDLTSGSAKFNLYGADSQEYPQLEEDHSISNEGINIKQSELKQILKEVIFAVSSDEGRPAFNGIQFSFHTDGLKITASDTYRLVIQKITFNHRSGEVDLLVPARSIRELIKILEDKDLRVMLYHFKNKVIFAMEQTYFAARVLNEKFPDVSSVIPAGYRTKLRLERKLFEETVSRASLLADGVNQAIQLLVRDGEMEVKVSSKVGRMEEILPVQKEGEDLDIYVNSRFILDLLRVAGSEEISLEFNGKNGPIIIKMVNNENYLYLILPIKME